jgi:3alpha(or 20beta)-hydroxysteroid dehydrogenase
MTHSEALADKVVIVTGGAQGIGEATARRLALDGASVVIADVLDEAGLKVAVSLGERAIFRHLDVTDAAQWSDCVEATQRTFGTPTSLVSNAGVMVTGSVETSTADDFRRAFDVNTIGALLGIQAVAAPMRSNGGGSIVVVSSLSGLIASEGQAPYCASKAAGAILTRCAALELGDDQIRVNSVHPGRIETPMSQAASADLPSVGSYQGPPLGRLGQVDEVAALIAFLLSDESAYMTGTQQVIDGGRLAGLRYPRTGTN